MQQVFVDSNAVDGIFEIKDADAHHLIRVVRIRIGEKIRVSNQENESFLCQVIEIDGDCLKAEIVEQMESTELPNKIYLFQALPKGDRMENIIEKCVELGVHEIIPVEMKNCVVKLDDKKKKNKVTRYNSVALMAAQQSKRSIVPVITDVMSFKEAYEYAKSMDIRLFTYEGKNGIQDTYDVLASIKPNQSIAVFVGPEGGFDASEVDMIKDTMHIISLGKRILRTDTAAICSLSMLMLKCEEFCL